MKGWLVCAPADSPRMVRGSVFGHRCTKCGVEVMIAPSGQRLLEVALLDLLIVCGPCFDKHHNGCPIVPAAGPKQMARESRGALINPRRKRNN